MVSPLHPPLATRSFLPHHGPLLLHGSELTPSCVLLAAEIAPGEEPAEPEVGEDGEPIVPPEPLSRVEVIDADEFLVAITSQLSAVGAALPARELHAATLCETRAAVRKEQAALLQGRIEALRAKEPLLPL